MEKNSDPQHCRWFYKFSKSLHPNFILRKGGDVHLDVKEDRGLSDEGGLLGLLLGVGLQPLSPAHAGSSF
jgi:hypothetical protein